MRYQFVSDHKQISQVEATCRSLQVVRSGYNTFERVVLSPRNVEEGLLVEKIRQSHGRSRLAYGSPWVTFDLREAGDLAGKNRIARLMRLHGTKIRMYWKRKRTTRTDNGRKLADDLVNQQFTIGHPERVWVSDITYIGTDQGWFTCVCKWTCITD